MVLNRLAVIATTTWLFIRRRRRQCRQKRLYIRAVNLGRSLEGEFVKLVLPMRACFPDDHFSYFRMTSARFDDLLARVGPYISHAPTHRFPITPIERLAITVRYLASGTSLSSLQFSYRIGVATMTKIIRETTAAIWRALEKDFLRPPTRNEWEDISNEFWRKWNFPMCLGAIDGKHISIKSPPHSGSLFYNYKNFFSTVLLAVVDANYKFVFVDIGGYGSEGDAGLFHRSSFGHRLDLATQDYDEGGLALPYDNFLPGTGMVSPHVFLGDQAFPLHRHLMRPFQRQTANGNEEIFNYRLSRARRVVENAFGILTTRWRVLESRIDLRVSTVDDVVKACVALHNYLKSTDAIDHKAPRYIPDNYVDYETDGGDLILGSWRENIDHNYALLPMDTDRQETRVRYSVRDKFKTFFASDEGSIPWQDDSVKRGQY